MTGVFAAGRIINAKTARSQLMGGMIWGVSSALHEAAHVDPRHGNWVNGDLAEYLMPVHADIPAIETVLLDDYDEHANHLGIKGIGELGVCGTGRRSATQCSTPPASGSGTFRSPCPSCCRDFRR